jgi:hypothetical protein
MSFEKKPVCFFIRGSEKGQSISFLCNLAELPRRGDEISFPFIDAYLKMSSLYVEEIRHIYVNGRIETTIHACGRDSFLSNLTQQAIFERELSFTELWSMSDYNLEEKLRGLYGGKPWTKDYILGRSTEKSKRKD